MKLKRNGRAKNVTTHTLKERQMIVIKAFRESWWMCALEMCTLVAFGAHIYGSLQNKRTPTFALTLQSVLSSRPLCCMKWEQWRLIQLMPVLCLLPVGPPPPIFNQKLYLFNASHLCLLFLLLALLLLDFFLAILL